MIFFLLLGWVATVSAEALPTVDLPYDKPLVTLKFEAKEKDFQDVYYQLPLENAVRYALVTAPGSFFDIVSVIPTSGDYQTDHERSVAAFHHIEDVMETMREMGVPRARMQANYTSSSEIDYNEVRVFVR